MEALAELVETIVEEYRDKEAEQPVVLIGHSLGTAVSAYIANRNVKHTTHLAEYVAGLIAICPISGPKDEKFVAFARRFLWVPGWLFGLWRTWDGMGGTESPSVKRFVGDDPDPELARLQYKFNKQSQTPVWRRMFSGTLPTYVDGKPQGGIPGLDVWAALTIPVYLIAGEKDNITSPEEAKRIVAALKNDVDDADSNQTGHEEAEELLADTAAPVSASTRPEDHIPQRIDDITGKDFERRDTAINETSQDPHEDPHEDPSTPLESPADVPALPRHPRQVIKTMVMPAPATHALLYSPRSVRVLAGLIADFLAKNITGRLSLGWQLQYLSREGKWDVKNLNKWKSVVPVSHPIGPADKPIFRALKTLREADDVHCPKEFVAKWGKIIKDVIDISKDQPVYDSGGLERAGIHYHKFPTVSKIPPQHDEVEAFIQLVDKLRATQAERREEEAWDDEGQSCVIGVHCHYGFNRTGYFLVCYLVERCGYGVKDAIETFAKARPNGIRHSHFLDRLYVRYSVDQHPPDTTV
jgi:alpha-beta hydrolase superfamily lysophospholipase/protein-tyrosine phosphatase